MVHYTGLKRRSSYDELVNYINTEQPLLKYPSRYASFLINSPQVGMLLELDETDEGANDCKRNRASRALANALANNTIPINATTTTGIDVQLFRQDLDNVVPVGNIPRPLFLPGGSGPLLPTQPTQSIQPIGNSSALSLYTASSGSRASELLDDWASHLIHPAITPSASHVSSHVSSPREAMAPLPPPFGSPTPTSTVKSESKNGMGSNAGGSVKSERQSGTGSKVATGELPRLESEADYGSGSRASNRSVKEETVQANVPLAQLVPLGQPTPVYIGTATASVATDRPPSVSYSVPVSTASSSQEGPISIASTPKTGPISIASSASASATNKQTLEFNDDGSVIVPSNNSYDDLNPKDLLNI